MPTNMIDILRAAVQQGISFEIHIGELLVDYRFQKAAIRKGVTGPVEHLKNMPPGFLAPKIIAAAAETMSI